MIEKGILSRRTVSGSQRQRPEQLTATNVRLAPREKGKNTESRNIDQVLLRWAGWANPAQPWEYFQRINNLFKGYITFLKIQIKLGATVTLNRKASGLKCLFFAFFIYKNYNNLKIYIYFTKNTLKHVFIYIYIFIFLFKGLNLTLFILYNLQFICFHKSEKRSKL